MAPKFDNDTVAKAYARWAPVYDIVFGAVFDRGRKASIAAAERIGGHILEVGVGTGLSLPDYSRANRLTGIDLSVPMLQKAKMRAAQHRLGNVDGLAVMDAQKLGFRDGVFDVVVAQYVITAVPNPEATLDEFVRVLKPGGEIVLVNHLGAEFWAACAVRSLLCAVGAAARMAPGISLGAAHDVGAAPWRRSRPRAAADATAWAFLADPLRVRLRSLSSDLKVYSAATCAGAALSLGLSSQASSQLKTFSDLTNLPTPSTSAQNNPSSMISSSLKCLASSA